MVPYLLLPMVMAYIWHGSGGRRRAPPGALSEWPICKFSRIQGALVQFELLISALIVFNFSFCLIEGRGHSLAEREY